MKNKNTLIINLFSGPGVGKSALAAGLFYMLKSLKYNVELVTEYAKELVYENRYDILKKDQLYIFAKQNRKIKRCVDYNELDFIITDSALILSAIYNDYSDTPEPDEFTTLCTKKFNEYNNLNIILSRCFNYNTNDRYQDETTAIEIDNKIKEFLNDNSIEYKETNTHSDILNTVTDIVLNEHTRIQGK